MSLHAQILEMKCADAAAKVQQMLAGSAPATQTDTWRALAELGTELRQSLRLFGALRAEREALAAQTTATVSDPGQNTHARLARFDAEWWRVWRSAARLATLLMALEPRSASASASTWSASVQTLAFEIGERPEPSLARALVQRLAAQPDAVLASAGTAGSPWSMDTLLVTLALATVLLQRRGVTP